MKDEMPAALSELAMRQRDVVSRKQALQAGMTAGMIKFRVQSGRWRQVHTGVYATFSGELTRRARIWAALLYAGTGAVLSHETAAEMGRLTREQSDVIHIAVPRERRVAAVPGVRFHRITREPGVNRPPYTSALETVLDLVQAADTLDDACAWVTRAVQQGLKVPALRAAVRDRGSMRWRREMEEVFAAAMAGDESVLEYRYTKDVERAHQLPEATRQVAFTGPDGRSGRRDRVYERFRVVVELDGKLFHRDRRKDQRRDNAATANGLHPLRYGWSDVRYYTCLTAAEVAQTLSEHGWDGQPRPCSAGCPVGTAR
jgi:hypothetical protein